MSPDNPLCPSCGELPAPSLFALYTVCMGHLVAMYVYGNSYIATFSYGVYVWWTRWTICAHACMAHVCNPYRFIAIHTELHCTWKPLSIIPTRYSKLLCIYAYWMPICVWDRYSSHTRMGHPVCVWDNIRILGRTGPSVAQETTIDSTLLHLHVSVLSITHYNHIPVPGRTCFCTTRWSPITTNACMY